MIDTSQIAGYALQETERELLLALALYEIRSLLDGGLRFRTACDFEVQALRAERPEGFELASLGDLGAAIRTRVDRPAEPVIAVFGS